MPSSAVPEGFREALLFEFDIAQRQLLALANSLPGDKYGWRPDATARAVSEILVHVAGGIFFLLELAGHTAPSEIYGDITAQDEEPLWVRFAKSNDELEKAMTAKDAVLEILTRSFLSAREAITQTSEAALISPQIRRTYMRLIAHTHEHMGQMIAYTRINGLCVPWPDWRPDKR